MGYNTERHTIKEAQLSPHILNKAIHIIYKQYAPSSYAEYAVLISAEMDCYCTAKEVEQAFKR